MSEPFVTHSGRCHCGAVTFTVLASKNLIAWECNCSICAMKRNVHFMVPKSHLTLLTGQECLTEYTFGTRVAKHLFCSRCGVTPFYSPRSNPDGWAVTVACVDPATVAAIKVEPYDGVQWEATYAKSYISSLTKTEATAVAIEGGAVETTASE